MRVPEYVLTEEHVIRIGIQDKKVLPVGSFVQPITWGYLPQHIKEELKKQLQQWEFNEYLYCYSRYGILPIPKKIIRKID